MSHTEQNTHIPTFPKDLGQTDPNSGPDWPENGEFTNWNPNFNGLKHDLSTTWAQWTRVFYTAPWIAVENIKIWSHCTFNSLKDVTVCELRSCAESNLRKAGCNAMVGVLDSVILYMVGSCQNSGRWIVSNFKKHASPSHFHIYNSVVAAAVKW